MGPFDCEHNSLRLQGQMKQASLACEENRKGVSMNKICRHLAAIALLVTLSGPALLGIGLGSVANAASSQHVSSSFAAGTLTRSVASIRYAPCPYPSAHDC